MLQMYIVIFSIKVDHMISNNNIIADYIEGKRNLMIRTFSWGIDYYIKYSVYKIIFNQFDRCKFLRDNMVMAYKGDLLFHIDNHGHDK